MEQAFTPQKICICGAGTMGRGIAQVMAGTGFPVVLYDVDADGLQSAKKQIEASLQELVQKGRLAAGAPAILLQNLTFTSDPDQCRADLIIEAIVEHMEAKVALFRALAARNAPQTILASNTSSLSLTRMAQQLPQPERLAGLHFFNPAPVMKLVEVIQTPFTPPHIIAYLQELVRKTGKTPVVCQDAPGFIVNRVARPFYLEALRLAEKGMAFSAIDKVLEAKGFKMGPFRLMDLIGNDINFAVSNSLYEQLNRPARLQPSGLQQEKVEKGDLGRKSGRGYYIYG